MGHIKEADAYQLVDMKSQLAYIEDLLLENFPDNTERSIALGQLEDCFGWAAKSIVKEDIKFSKTKAERKAMNEAFDEGQHLEDDLDDTKQEER